MMRDAGTPVEGDLGPASEASVVRAKARQRC
jgi:hypothetical protein